MDWKYWKPYYDNVVNLLDLNRENDIKVAIEYQKIVASINKDGFNKLLEEIRSKSPLRAWIFGAGPSLQEDIKIFNSNFNVETDIIVAADGSCLFLLENNLIPNFIFSDLDGSIESLIELGSNGSILVVHAHGDNLKLIQETIPKLVSINLLPTIQTKPIEPFIYNFGGFTDGDRAISAILSWYPDISNVILLGFTFGKIQGQYSKPNSLRSDILASEFKIKKLEFAKSFLAVIAKENPLKIWNLSQPTDSIFGIQETVENIYTINKMEN